MTDSTQKRMVLGVSGGVAAYKAAELVRLLDGHDVEVQVVMTEAATHFVGPATFEALSHRPVERDLWRPGFAHIDLSRNAQAILVAPASADFMAKVAHGFADDLLSALCLARNCPLYLAPAMNHEMWANAATQRNVATLRADGVTLLGPADGPQACGEVGVGRMLEPEEIAATMLAVWQPKLLAGKRVLVSAGPTFEAIDAVRGIFNLSSGKMGYALARAALAAGAEVTLVSGPTALAAPSGAAAIHVTSAAQMLAAVEAEAPHCDIFISAAAVADYAPAQALAAKLEKSTEALELRLEPTVDIVARVAARPRPPYCVGFAAQTENLREHAERKRRAKKLPLIIANRVPEAFGSDLNEVVLIDANGAEPLGPASKDALAQQIIAHIAQRLPAFEKESTHAEIQSSHS